MKRFEQTRHIRTDSRLPFFLYSHHVIPPFPLCFSESTSPPVSHQPGEVYVLNDGGEADLDLGNYERYLDVTLNRDNNITTGKVYMHVIEREVSTEICQSTDGWVVKERLLSGGRSFGVTSYLSLTAHHPLSILRTHSSLIIYKFCREKEIT